MKGFFKYFTRWMVAFVLVMIPVIVLADIEAAGSSPLWDMFREMSFEPPPGDMSVQFLAKMFGYVPGVPYLASGGSTILGAIFSVFNNGILTLSGVFLGYTVTKILTETTMDGSAMGKSTTIWTSVRCALSTSLLVPQTSGYSMINGIIMWVVIQSVGLADMTWNRAMDYLKEGGPLYAPPSAMIDYTLINHHISVTNIPDAGELNGSNKRDGSVGSADVLRCLTCAYAVHGALRENQKINRKRLQDLMQDQSLTDKTRQELQYASRTIPEKGETFSVYKNFDNEKYYQFPYIKDEADRGKNPLKKFGLKMRNSVIDNLDLSGMCGKISYDVVDDNGRSVGTDIMEPEQYDRYLQAKKQGLADMIAILEPVAKKLVNETKIDSSDDNSKRKLYFHDYKLYINPDNNNDEYFFRTLDRAGNPLIFSRLPNTTVSNRSISRFLEGDGNGGFTAEYMTRPKMESHLSASFKALSTRVPNIKKLNELDFKWPLGTDEILEAAAKYQLALANAQSYSSAVSDADRNDKFEAAKEKGWIAAGGYYRLLVDEAANVTKEYKYYRLTKKGSTNLISNNRGVANPLMFDTIFPAAFEKKSGLARQTSIFAINRDYEKIFANTMKWILLTYPYAKIRGEMISPPLTFTETGVGYSAPSLGSMSEGGIIAIEVTSYITMTLGLASVYALLLQPLAITGLTFVPLLWLQHDVDKVFRKWDEVMGVSNASMDPILKLKTLGDHRMKSAMDYMEQIQNFFIGMTVTVATMSATTQLAGALASPFSFLGIGVGLSMSLNILTQAMTSLMDLAQAIVFMYIPLGIAVMGPMFVSGTIFSIYVPMIPYLLFLFGAISWFISVLVLMAAAPIICFLMLWGNQSQENPLLAREAEQFIMQVIGVFFRPTLMVIGLIAGMVLCHIGVDILNLGFSHFVSDFIVEADTGGKMALIKQVGVVSIYTFTMLTVVNMSFSTIYLLYSEAMRVAGISAPAVGMEQQQLEAVKGAATQISEAGSAGMKGQATAIKGAAKMKGTSLSTNKKNKEEGGGGVR